MLRPLMPGEPYEGMPIMIHPDLAQFPPEDDPGIVPEMLLLAGKSDMIWSCEPGSYIYLADSGFSWCEQWLLVDDPEEEPNIETDLEDVL